MRNTQLEDIRQRISDAAGELEAEVESAEPDGEEVPGAEMAAELLRKASALLTDEMFADEEPVELPVSTEERERMNLPSFQRFDAERMSKR